MSTLTWLLPILAAGAPVDHFDEGLRLFRDAQAYEHEHATGTAAVAQKYRASAHAFQQALDQGLVTSEVLTNLGNANYFAGDIGLAVLNYRRALLLDSSNARARDALDSIQRQLPIRTAPGSQTESLFASLFFWHRSLSFELKKTLFLATWVCAWVGLIAARSKRRWFAGMAVLALIMAGGLGVSLGWDIWADPAVNRAVIITQAEGRRGDGDAYSASHSEPFPPGTEGIVLETRHNEKTWINIRLPDNSETWLESSDLERVISDNHSH
jgi:hypothetical protein